LLEALAEGGFDTVVTFGSRGVSGHKNHVSCHGAAEALEARLAVHPLLKAHLRFRYLRDSSLFEKYGIDLRRKHLFAPFVGAFGFRNMLVFRTQMVYFRYLYCMASNYMHYNILSHHP